MLSGIQINKPNRTWIFTQGKPVCSKFVPSDHLFNSLISHENNEIHDSCVYTNQSQRSEYKLSSVHGFHHTKANLYGLKMLDLKMLLIKIFRHVWVSIMPHSLESYVQRNFETWIWNQSSRRIYAWPLKLHFKHSPCHFPILVQPHLSTWDVH